MLPIFDSVGYFTFKETINIAENIPQELQVEMKSQTHQLEELVITGTRTERKLNESPVSVNVLDKSTLAATQSVTLSEGLNFQSGLRVETDCQTCNYTQLRMNGLGGAYSQILINNRPVFNALMGLYGLEQLPVNMIEKVEIVKGGGSAIYGSSAIAGTINVITKQPEKDHVKTNEKPPVNLLFHAA